MIINLFSLPIYKINILDQIDTSILEEKLQEEFSQSSNDVSGLEKNGGISTYNYRDWETDRKSTRLNSSHRL